MAQIKIGFEIGQKVKIDGGDVAGIVTAFELRPGTHRYEVSWFHSGDAKFCMFDEFRLSAG